MAPETIDSGWQCHRLAPECLNLPEDRRRNLEALEENSDVDPTSHDKDESARKGGH